MSTEEAIFLVEKFEKQSLGRILKGTVLEDYYEAERILRGWDKKQPRGCSCDYKNMARIVTSLFDQNKPTIYQLYNEYKEGKAS